MSRDLQAMSDRVARLAWAAAKAHKQLGEALAELGVALDEHDTSPKPSAQRGRGPAWTDEQLTIVREHFPVGGADAVLQALEAAGYPERTKGAIYTQVKRLRLVRGDGLPLDLILSVVRDYRGLPLTVDDVRDSCGNLSRKRARAALEELTEQSLIASRTIEGNVTVWYDHTAEDEAAA